MAKKKKNKGLRSNLTEHERRKIEEKIWRLIPSKSKIRFKTKGGPSRSGFDRMTREQKIKTLKKRIKLKP